MKNDLTTYIRFLVWRLLQIQWLVLVTVSLLYGLAHSSNVKFVFLLHSALLLYFSVVGVLLLVRGIRSAGNLLLIGLSAYSLGFSAIHLLLLPNEISTIGELLILVYFASIMTLTWVHYYDEFMRT